MTFASEKNVFNVTLCEYNDFPRESLSKSSMEENTSGKIPLSLKGMYLYEQRIDILP